MCQWILYAVHVKELQLVGHKFRYLWEILQKGFHKTFEILWKIFPSMNVYSVSHFQNIKWGEEGNGMKLCTGKTVHQQPIYTHFQEKKVLPCKMAPCYFFFLNAILCIFWWKLKVREIWHQLQLVHIWEFDQSFEKKFGIS